MKAILGMQILEKFRRKRISNEVFEELDGDEVILFVAEAVIEVCRIKERNIPQETKQVSRR